MASYALSFLFLSFLALSLSFQTHARDSKFFSKVAKTRKKTTLDPISISPAISPSLAPSPSPEPEVVERGYGLYGREPYEFTPTTANPTNTPILGEEKYVPVDELSSNEFYGNGNEHQYHPTTGNPTKTPVVGEEKYVAPAGLSNNNFNGNGNEKKGMSDTRFLENGKYFYDVQNEANNYENENFEKEKHGMNRGNYEMNGNGNGKQGMSDTRYLEKGKYYYHINSEEGAKEEQTTHFNANNFDEEKRGMDRYAQSNGNGNGYVSEKQGMSDTRFLENGKYFYDLNSEKGYSANNNNNNENVEDAKHGMSDTRFMENGKYFYDVKNENSNSNNMYYNNDNHNNNAVHGNEGFLNKNYNGYGNEEEDVYEGNNGYVTQGRGGYNHHENTKKLPNDESYVTEERKGNYGSTKKLPNTYDTMEEYDREQGYIDPKDIYVP